MKTGIVILNYNDYENTLRVVEQVESYFSLSYIIIVDNCSPNKENLKLKELENDRIVFLRADENKGYGSGNNIGLRYLEEHTDCELVIISNPDIEVKEEVILKMQEDMQTNSFISFLGPVISELGKSIKGWKFPSYFVEVLSTINFVSRYASKFQMYPESYYQSSLTQVDVIHGSFFMARLSDFKKIDYFDENTFLYYEENIIGKKALEKNLKIYVDNEVSVIHALSVSVNKSLNKIRKYKILKKSMFYYERCYNKRNFVAILFLKILYFLSLGISFLTFWI